MLTPATARTGCAFSCCSLGSSRPAAAHGRDTLQLLPQTSAVTHTHPTKERTARLGSHSDPRDEVSSLVVVGAGGRSLHRRAHSVFVVLADKDARQLPQRSHVEGLKQLALIGLERKMKPKLSCSCFNRITR